jgi:hypothetical protein
MEELAGLLVKAEATQVEPEELADLLQAEIFLTLLAEKAEMPLQLLFLALVFILLLEVAELRVFLVKAIEAVTH